MDRFVLLDRDGVINADRDDYVKNVGELVIFPWAPPAIARLCRAGFRIAVVSNQQGVGRGHVQEEDLQAIERAIRSAVVEAGGEIAAFRYCRHLSSDGCDCRKPKPGMILDLQREFALELSETFYVGDTWKDVVAAHAAGCRSLLVLTGHTRPEDVPSLPAQPEAVFPTLAEAVEFILRPPSP